MRFTNSFKWKKHTSFYEKFRTKTSLYQKKYMTPLVAKNTTFGKPKTPFAKEHQLVVQPINLHPVQEKLFCSKFYILFVFLKNTIEKKKIKYLLKLDLKILKQSSPAACWLYFRSVVSGLEYWIIGYTHMFTRF